MWWTTVVATIAVAVQWCTVVIVGRRTLAPQREKETRAKYERLHPHECVRCGYDVRRCPGPNCPECGEPLGENQGQRTVADSPA